MEKKRYMSEQASKDEQSQMLYQKQIEVEQKMHEEEQTKIESHPDEYDIIVSDAGAKWINDTYIAHGKRNGKYRWNSSDGLRGIWWNDGWNIAGKYANPLETAIPPITGWTVNFGAAHPPPSIAYSKHIWAEGQRAAAYWEGGKRSGWYTGKIESIAHDGICSIVFDDGSTKEFPKENLRRRLDTPRDAPAPDSIDSRGRADSRGRLQKGGASRKRASSPTKRRSRGRSQTREGMRSKNLTSPSQSSFGRRTPRSGSPSPRSSYS